MQHTMGLFESSFKSIKSGKKTVEVRLNDEKRRKISIGDSIIFTKVPKSNENLTVEVVELREFTTFKEMYERIPAKDFDTVGDPIDLMVQQTYEIYSANQENEWGTLAITVKLLEANTNSL
ncbi:ASCH domain-containing protein [Fundicoccus sp. Sow4_H7]|uniref:ASCH domain-containing protein n=1 Tax=Fundicoccus sp. Sow4_H7 TaxID=3438784 RepID=UPI003F8E1134